MSTFTVSLSIFLFILVSFNAEATRLASSPAAGVNKTWCIASPTATEDQLKANINYVCQNTKVGKVCELVAPGGKCFTPNMVAYHASVAMNTYYQAMGKNSWNCDFAGTGIIVITNPAGKGNELCFPA